MLKLSFLFSLILFVIPLTFSTGISNQGIECVYQQMKDNCSMWSKESECTYTITPEESSYSCQSAHPIAGLTIADIEFSIQEFESRYKIDHLGTSFIVPPMWVIMCKDKMDDTKTHALRYNGEYLWDLAGILCPINSTTNLTLYNNQGPVAINTGSGNQNIPITTQQNNNNIFYDPYVIALVTGICIIFLEEFIRRKILKKKKPAFSNKAHIKKADKMIKSLELLTLTSKDIHKQNEIFKDIKTEFKNMLSNRFKDYESKQKDLEEDLKKASLTNGDSSLAEQSIVLKRHIKAVRDGWELSDKSN